MRFIILMWQSAKQDLNDTPAVNSGSSCSRIILGGIIHFTLGREPLWGGKTKTERVEDRWKKDGNTRNKKSERVTIFGAVIGREYLVKVNSVRSLQNEGRLDGGFDRVQGDFVIRRTGAVCITRGSSLAVHPLMRSRLYRSVSLSPASRCRKRAVFAALPKKRYKTGASWAWPQGRGRSARGNRTQRLAERNGNGCREKLMGNAHLEKRLRIEQAQEEKPIIARRLEDTSPGGCR